MAGPAVGRLHPGRPGESKGQPKLVDALPVRPRTRVRFPPPPSFLRRPLERPTPYPPSDAFSEIYRRMSGCVGIITFGMRHSQEADGESSPGATPWTHVEAGMAYACSEREFRRVRRFG